MSMVYSRKMDGRPSQQTLYEILELPTHASQEEIHQGYLRAKATYSPDSPALYSIFSPEEAEQLLLLIHEAYMVLSNPVKRKDYDDQLTNPSSEGPKIKPVPPKNEMPSGEPEANKVSAPYGRTIFSHFAINPDFEKEIASQTAFDGVFLKKIREYKNVSLEQMSTHTRVGKNYLIALEKNDFHSLPAPVFVRGFVTHIARTLGLDTKQVVASFMSLFKVKED